MPQTPPFEIEGIDHILLLVKGLRPALAFYCEALGCRVADELPQFAMVQLRAGGALIDLVDIDANTGRWARPDVAGGRNLDHVCIALSALDEARLRRHLAAHGVQIIEEVVHTGARGESLSFYVRDPAGNTIELKGPPARAGARR
jgi:glyoxylase I family protein